MLLNTTHYNLKETTNDFTPYCTYCQWCSCSSDTAQKVKFSIKDFFKKFDQARRTADLITFTEDYPSLFVQSERVL